MASRNNRRKKFCRNCDSPNVVAKAAKKAAEQTPSVISEGTESVRLWRHVLYGTGTCVGMMEGYAALGMEGASVEQIQALIVRLDKLISTVQNKQ